MGWYLYDLNCRSTSPGQGSPYIKKQFCMFVINMINRGNIVDEVIKILQSEYKNVDEIKHINMNLLQLIAVNLL